MFNRSIHEQWTIQIYMASEDSYERLHIENRIFPNWIVSHIVKGNVQTGSGGEAYAAEAGDVMIHPPYIPFFERSGHAGTHQWLSFQIMGRHNLEVFKRYPVSPVVRLADPAAFRRVFNALLGSWREADGSFRALNLSADAMRLVSFILQNWDAAGRPSRSEAFRTKRDRYFFLISYMSEHLGLKITREHLAEQIHLSANHLDKAFFRAYGMTPMKMLREMRLNKAKLLLETTDDSLSSIAQACGMGDAAYLSRQFAKAFHCTPGNYRESIRTAGSNYMTDQG